MHLVYDTESDEYYWNDISHSNMWTYGDINSVMSIGSVLKIFGNNLPDTLPQNYTNTFNELLGTTNTDNHNIPLFYAVPRKKFIKAIKNMLHMSLEAIRMIKNKQYIETFIRSREFIMGLERACVDDNKLSEYTRAEKSLSVISSLKTFQPDHDGFANAVVYSRDTSSTGRMVVKEGPRILTLPKRYRDILVSRYKGGSIIQLDFISLEPRVALSVCDKNISGDIYKHLSDKLFGGFLDRQTAKIAVLSALYGMSTKKFGDIINCELDPKQLIDDISEYFCTKSTVSSIRNKMQSDGYVSNYFGRPLIGSKLLYNSPSGSLMSHYIQSSAVDVALLGFSSFISDMPENLNATPLFVIHDALVIDVCRDSMDWFTSAANKSININNLGQFPLEMSIINNGV